MAIDRNIATGVGLGLVGLAALWLVARSVKSTLGDALNPTSSGNLAYSGVNGVGAAVSGNKDFSLGVWIYELFHPAAGKTSTPKASASVPNTAAVRQAQADRAKRLGTKPPSILTPDQNGVGPSFEQASKPDYPFTVY